MILAGIDEAGYGPLLGPLVVGCAAFEIQSDAPEPPCLWATLRRVVSKTRSRDGRKLHVNDSKRVYTPAEGLAQLERSTLALAAAFRDWTDQCDDFVASVAGDLPAHLDQYPWYRQPPGSLLPLAQDALSVRLMANALKKEMQRSAVSCVHLQARVVLESQFNDLMTRSRNKASALFDITAVHLDHLLRAYGSAGLTVWCDRQGGRQRYGHLLRLMFEDWDLQIVQETEAISRYNLKRGLDTVRLIFREKAESAAMSVAVASMLCKYLRELLMARFNAYWLAQVPGLAPTAGYWTDGQRFLRDIAARRLELGIPDAQLVRSR